MSRLGRLQAVAPARGKSSSANRLEADGCDIGGVRSGFFIFRLSCDIADMLAAIPEADAQCGIVFFEE